MPLGQSMSECVRARMHVYQNLKLIIGTNHMPKKVKQAS